MRLIVSDTPIHPAQGDTAHILIEHNDALQPCRGCFGCWIKTPGACVLPDGYQNLGAQLGHCSELILISKCTYGCVSPFVKNALDRSIGSILPTFETIGGQMHHKKRYDTPHAITAYFYGDHITDAEKQTAQALLKAVAVNLHGTLQGVTFLKSLTELEGLL